MGFYPVDLGNDCEVSTLRKKCTNSCYWRLKNQPPYCYAGIDNKTRYSLENDPILAFPYSGMNAK